MTILGNALAISAALAGSGIAARRLSRPSSERALIAVSIWLVIVAPIVTHAAPGNQPSPLASSIGLAVSLIALAVSALVRVRFADWARAFAITWRDLLLVPLRALIAPLRARSSAFFGVLLVLLGLFTVATDRHPSVVALLGVGPVARASAVHARPLLLLLTHAVSGAAIASAGYVLARRQAADRVEALGWGSLIALAPCALRVLRIEGTESASVALLLGASALGLRKTLDAFDVLIGFAALSAVTSLSTWGIAYAFPIALAISAFTALARQRIGSLVSPLAISAGLVSLTVAVLAARRLPVSSFRIGAPIDDLVTLWDVPLRGDPMTSAQGFGIGFAWTLLPAALVALVFMLADLLLALVRHLKKSACEGRSLPWEPLLIVVVLTLSTLFRAPPEVALVGASVILASWLVTRLSAPRIGEGLIALNVLAAVTFHYWYGY